ncbi:MAG: amidohydrolase family protein [Devosia sp.]|uniref:dihydroorotase n=1 Tax=Devosia sp. TaxID=1871048 RepID=UPI00263792FD|nr:amidohydrolase family protein [Devosia sp.]MDB5531104.1 amidohydrolase family protein [Devosia sp.]
MYDLLIAGRVVSPSAILDDGWLAISGGTIAAVGQGGRPQAKEVADYGMAYLLPGGIDGQTHAGSQIGFPGLTPTTEAAVRGGVTTIIDMPYDEPDPIITRALLQQKVDAVGQYAICDVALYGTVPAEPNPDDIAALINGGVCAFKISSFQAHPHRFPRIDNGATLVLIDALEGRGLPLGLHNEDQDIIRRTTERFKAEGRTRPEDHSASRPEVAELTATATFLELGRDRDIHLHIVHISTPQGFEIVERYRQAGVDATAEMCFHYLHFDAATDMTRLGGQLKVNPPIRDGVREDMWEVIEQDGATFVSSDHSAWPIERKTNPSILDVAAGMPGLEALLPGFFTEAAERYGADNAAMMVADLGSDRAARFFGLSRKGRLAPGMDADVAVMAPVSMRYDAKSNPTGPGWSAYDGETFAVTPAATFVRGQLVWDGAAIRAKAGTGRFVARG